MFDNVTKSIDGRDVLSDVTFTLQKGEFLGYLGPNGAGKTTTIRLILDILRPTSGKVFLFETKTGLRRMYFAKYADCRSTKNFNDAVINFVMRYLGTTTTFEGRLKAKVCELCGTTQGECFVLHYVNKVKNLKGKEFWERVMIAKRRKTLAVCRECHYKIYHQ